MFSEGKIAFRRVPPKSQGGSPTLHPRFGHPFSPGFFGAVQFARSLALISPVVWPSMLVDRRFLGMPSQNGPETVGGPRRQCLEWLSEPPPA
jgi:hypothetical protein